MYTEGSAMQLFFSCPIKQTAKPQLQINCLFSNKPETEEWVLGRTPTYSEKRRMVANMLGVGVKAVMDHHTYMVGDDMFLQSEVVPLD